MCRHKGLHLFQSEVIDNSIMVFPESFFIEEESSEDLLKRDITRSIDSALGTTQDLGLSHIPSGSNLYKILKVVFNAFIYNIPGLSAHPISAIYSREVSSEVLRLLLSALKCFSSLVNSSVIKKNHGKDLIPLLLFIQATILENEGFAKDVSQTVLINLKTTLDSLSAEFGDGNQLLLCGLLESMLESILSFACSDEGENTLDSLDLSKIKNCLLATTIIVTTQPNLCHTMEIKEKISIALLQILQSGVPQVRVLQHFSYFT